MKETVKAAYDLAASWGTLPDNQLEDLLAALKVVDEDTISRAYHQTVQRNYLRARNSLIWSLCGIILTIALGVPGIYLYFRDQRSRERQVAIRIHDAEELLGGRHFLGARKLIDSAKQIDPSSPSVYLADIH